MQGRVAGLFHSPRTLRAPATLPSLSAEDTITCLGAKMPVCKCWPVAIRWQLRLQSAPTCTVSKRGADVLSAAAQVIEDTATVVQHVRKERGVPRSVPNIVIGGSYGEPVGTGNNCRTASAAAEQHSRMHEPLKHAGMCMGVRVELLRDTWCQKGAGQCLAMRRMSVHQGGRAMSVVVAVSFCA